MVPSTSWIVSKTVRPASSNISESVQEPKRPRSRLDRTSFSSLKESSSSVAQSFTDSKVSSLLEDEEALETDSGLPTNDMATRTITIQHHHSASDALLCLCQGFRGWKQIAVRGKVASKSSGDLKSLKMGWDWDVKPEKKGRNLETCEKTMDDDGAKKAKQTHLEKLPIEVLGGIIDQLYLGIPPNGFTARNVDLMSLLLTSRALHSVTLATLYNKVTIPHSRIFRKFLSHVKEYPALGTMVRRLDFSHFNPTGAGQSARERAETLNLIPATLLQCLELTPNLQEFLVQEHIEDDLDLNVMQKLLCDLPKLKALDFCACSAGSFRDAFVAIIDGPNLPQTLPITRLSLHECAVLPGSVLSTLLPRLPFLTHLDIAHTRITDSALLSIPVTSRLTHLNLSKCSNLSGEGVLEFLTTHPSASTLVYLNLSMDTKYNDMLSSEDLEILLPALPTTLRSLNLKGSKMNSTHIPLLIPLSKHLEELGLGRHLDLYDLCKLVIREPEDQSWTPHTLHYLDISDLSTSELDLGTLFGSSCPLLKHTSLPLEVLEPSPEVFKKFEKSSGVKRVGWCLKEAGRRGWLVRDEMSVDGGRRDEGARSWKWGAMYWGMRKCPVARAEVGGMYGHYMFKR